MSSDPFDIFDNEPLQVAPKTETSRTRNERIAKLQIANGGEKEGVTCLACKGRGNFVSYTGRIVGRCFKCDGKGKVSARKAGAQKAQQTKKANDAAWLHAHHAEIAHMGHRAESSSFYASLQTQFRDKGRLTEGQIAAIRKDMAEEPARLAAFKAKSDEAKAAKSGEVDLSKIEELFDTARSNGLKKLKFRTEACDISPAPEHGRNAGSLYVTKGDEYFGKLTNGKFFATREAPETIIEQLRELAKDPLAVGVAYGKQTGKCCICARELTDPASVEAGIGPICAGNWGL